MFPTQMKAIFVHSVMSTDSGLHRGHRLLVFFSGFLFPQKGLMTKNLVCKHFLTPALGTHTSLNEKSQTEDLEWSLFLLSNHCSVYCHMEDFTENETKAQYSQL